MKETDVGQAVTALLRCWGWDVFAEVGGPGLRRADVVATRGKLLITVELKVAMTFEVMRQALDWVPYAHRSYVGVYTGGHVHPLARRLLGDLGLGLFAVDRHRVFLLEEARINRRADVERLRRCLRPEHRDFAPAGTNGAHWTGFKSTAAALLKWVKSHPGATLKDAVRDVDHHYAHDRAARAGFVHWIRAGVIPGLRVENEKGVLRLYPKDTP